MSRFEDAFDKTYQTMYRKQHEPYKKYYVEWQHGEDFVDALERCLSLDDLIMLHRELESLLKRTGRIKSDGLDGDLSEPLRMLRYSAYSVPGIGWFDGIGHKPICTKTQYRKINDAIVEAIRRKDDKNEQT